MKWAVRMEEIETSQYLGQLWEHYLLLSKAVKAQNTNTHIKPPYAHTYIMYALPSHQPSAEWNAPQEGGALTSELRPRPSRWRQANRRGLTIFCIFLIVSVSHKKTNSNNELTCLSKASYLLPLCHRVPLLSKNWTRQEEWSASSYFSLLWCRVLDQM